MFETIPPSVGEREQSENPHVWQWFERPQNEHLKGTNVLIHQSGAKEDGGDTNKLMKYSRVFPTGLQTPSYLLLLESTNSLNLCLSRFFGGSNSHSGNTLLFPAFQSPCLVLLILLSPAKCNRWNTYWKF